MYKKMKNAVIALILILCLGLCGCGNGANNVNNDAANTTENVTDTTNENDTENVADDVNSNTADDVNADEDATEDAADVNGDESQQISYPLTIVDQMGRTVEIAENPQKIVSGYYISSSALIALGVSDRFVGIEAKAGSRPIYKLTDESILELPNVGSAKEFDIEACASAEPDLVIIPMKAKDNIEALEELGLTVLVVNPESKEQLKDMIQIFGTVTDTEDKANELISFIDANMTLLNEELAAADSVSVYLAGNSDLLSTAPSGMYQNDMIALAGGKNVAEEIDDTYWVEVSYEQILAWNPEYIILASDAQYTVEDVMQNEVLASCDAIVNGNVYQIPSKVEAWDSPVPGCILGSVWLAEVLHPDIIDEAFVNETIEEFYETFYGFSYSEN